MRIIATIAATVALLLGTITACSAVTATTADEQPKVMILGDSITQGAVGHHTWRYFFATTHPDIDFVGNKRGTFSIYGGDWDYRGANAYAVSGWDSDHAAVWGGSMTDPNPEPKLHQLPITDLVATYQPDTIVAAWGINDFNDGVTATGLIDAYRGWIAAARAQKPDVDFVISELPWTWGSLVAGRVEQFNGLLDGLAAEQSTETSRVVIARMTEPYTKAGDTYDGIHPNQQGEEKIARMIDAAYATLAPVQPEPVVEQPAATVQPVAPAVVVEPAPQAVQRPRAPRHLRAFDRGRFVVAKWRGPDATYVVRCGSARKVVESNQVRLRSDAHRCAVRTVTDGGKSPAKRVKVR